MSLINVPSHPIMRLLLTLPSLVAAAVATAAAQTPTHAAARARIDSLVNAEVAATPIAGVAIAVVRGRDTIALRGYGLADVENDVPVTADHIFRIGSITKQFTAAAILNLVEKGQLSLDDTVGARLPNLPRTWRRATIRQLLNHTSGIPSYTDIGPRWQRRWREDLVPDSLIALVSADTMNFPLGARWRYNNSGYVLLGMILEKFAGKSYATLMDEQYFKPLGLSGTSYCYPQPIIKKRANGYSRTGTTLSNAEYLSMTQPHAAGALCSTVRDLVRWNAALQGGKVVTGESLRRMTTPVEAAAARGYGFGIGSDTSMAGHRRISHGGGIHGFQSMLAYYPQDSLTVAVLVNSTPAPVDVIANNLARIVLGLPLVGGRPPRVAITAADRAAYVGDYVITLPNGQTMSFQVSVEGDRLMAKGQGQSPIELIPYGNHTFGADFDRALRVIFSLDKGRATGLRLQQGGADMSGIRRESGSR